MALLVPETQRVSHDDLVWALTAHYGSPGRLADYRQQFERITRRPGEDPSIFAVALETLAMKAFGDMGNAARLRILRDRFIAGQDSFELRRHLDSVAPETRIWDIRIGVECGRAMLIPLTGGGGNPDLNSPAVAHTSGVATGSHPCAFGISAIVAAIVGGCPASAACAIRGVGNHRDGDPTAPEFPDTAGRKMSTDPGRGGGGGGQPPGSAMELDPRTLVVVVRHGLLPPGSNPIHGGWLKIPRQLKLPESWPMWREDGWTILNLLYMRMCLS